MWKWIIIGTAWIGLFNSLPGRAADPEDIEDLLVIQERLQETLESAIEATVAVGYSGSGVIVSADGVVMSAEHVTGSPGRVVTLILHDGHEVKAEALGASRFADVGLLKIIDEGEWPFVALAPAGSTHVGDWCFALGHPGGYDEERGPVVRLGRIIANRRNLIQTDCQLIGGDSGGPLMSLDGRVIGIHSRVSEEIEENFHAPVEAALRHWELLMAGRVVPPRNGRGGAFLGVEIDLHPEGVIIDRVFEGSAAEQARLTVGDIITQIEDYHVASPRELAMTISSLKPEQEVIIRFLRDDNEETVKVKLGSRPQRNRSR